MYYLNRISTPGILALAVIFTAAPARASTDNYIELQLSTAKFAQMINTQIINAASFCPYEVPCPTGGGTCVVDHLEIGAAGPVLRASNYSSVPINPTQGAWMQKVLY